MGKWSCRRLLRSCASILSFALLVVDARTLAHGVMPVGEPSEDPAHGYVACEEGMAGDFPCANTALLATLPLGDLDTLRANDIWGWTDPETGVEYALLGLGNGTAFVDLRLPHQPLLIGVLPTRTQLSAWRDIKVYRDHAFVVSEARSHGMQIFDLGKLREITDPPVVLVGDAHYGEFGPAHNIVINEETGFAYAVGTDLCNGGLHMIDIHDPLEPTFAGCFSDDGYTHDAQCVSYVGKDDSYSGREICFSSNEDTLTLVDVTDKASPSLISRTPYEGSRYTHQGWLTEDHGYFLLDDELDESIDGHRTRTLVWDVSDLEAPFVTGFHESDSEPLDHNLYVHGKHVFQANYRSGVRVLRIGDLSQAELTEVAFFDTISANDLPGFSGTWSVYPYFESGVLIASDILQGLFVLKPDLSAIAECEDGIDNDGDGLRDHPEDPTCIDPSDASESLRLDVEIELPHRLRARGRDRRHGRVLRLVILGSHTVDVRDVDIKSLRLEREAALSHPDSRGRRARAVRPLDVNRDGFRDLLVRFRRGRPALEAEEDQICLVGLVRGEKFRACTALEPDEEHESTVAFATPSGVSPTERSHRTLRQ